MILINNNDSFIQFDSVNMASWNIKGHYLVTISVVWMPLYGINSILGDIEL